MTVKMRATKYHVCTEFANGVRINRVNPTSGLHQSNAITVPTAGLRQQTETPSTETTVPGTEATTPTTSEGAYQSRQ